MPLPPGADVAVIGSGYTGLSAALTLARAGRHVVVLEANAAGYGGSSRNGGQVGSGNQKIPVAELVGRFGEKRARALLEEGLAMLRHTSELIQRESIACDFARVGRFRGAISPAHYDAMARDLDSLHRMVGVAFFMVPRSEQHAEIGTDAYHGGSVLPDDAALQPARFHRGLLERAVAAGVELVPHTSVTSIERARSGTVVHTRRGRLAARNAIIATNGYAGRECPPLARRIMPIGSAILATQELAPELASRLIPKGRIVGNTARVLHYYRLSPDGRRMLFGGRMASEHATSDVRDFAPLHREMIGLFPELSCVAITHCWSGYVGYTRDVFPHLGVRDGIHFAMGYCGTGVARAVYFGHKIALKLLDRPDGRTAFDDLPFHAFPFHALAKRLVPLAVSGHRARDWLDRRG
ncbi:MAG: FAD-binding oxidoreductase [Myxococcales bacterium]|nr:FAD-binding oxidoreductase [Myxococcales bacterium]MDH5306360.1 FAD-binding oxidoreductase [Myxococcales bacterium]MDH5566997.1 FAD-binding oxidoreductase [Myxococcales bacterium]